MQRRSFVQMLGGLFGGGAAVNAGLVTAVPPAVSATGLTGMAGMGSMVMGENCPAISEIKPQTFLEKVAYEISHLTKRAAKHQVLKSAGIFPNWVKEDFASEYDDRVADQRMPTHIMSFKSVSHASKIRMARDYYINKRIEEWYSAPSHALSVLMQRQLDPEISRSTESIYFGPMQDDDDVDEIHKKRLRSRWY